MNKLPIIFAVLVPCATFAVDDIAAPNADTGTALETVTTETIVSQTTQTVSPVVTAPISETALSSQNPTSSIFPESAQNQAMSNCASQIFSNALATTMDQVRDDDPEHVIRGWIYKNFQDPKTIQKVLACPDVAATPDDETIKFPTVVTNLPLGRTITVNYETQKKILAQRVMIGEKRMLSDIGPSPRIGAPGDGAIWTNTEPAWYGILVVQSGTLNEFATKNHTISLKYLENNIDKFYPRGAGCTTKSALANDSDIVNIAAHRTVGLDARDEKDTNDYYVAGDANLQWITWAEVGLDVAITVATVGMGTVVLGATKAVRAGKAAKNLIGTIKTLEKSADVKGYITATRNAARAAEELKAIDRTTDAARYATKSAEVTRLGDTVRDLEKIDDVRKYKTAVTSFDDVMKLRRALKAWKIPQRGNVIARTFRAGRAAFTGGRTLNKAGKAARTARSSTGAGRIKDYLFRNTLQNVERLGLKAAGGFGKLEAAGGMLYGTMKFVGNMYDWSETSTGDFTSNIEFKPLGLLSADDLAGQENVVNHGMWLMWAGDSVSPMDDDAAYLQSMDFAAKFHQDMIETMDDENSTACDVDIYVVRPIIRNPGDPDEALYYLIMNDVPWNIR